MRTPRKLKPIQWGKREAALLAGLQERAEAEGVPVPTMAEAVRVAMAVATEASRAAWTKATR